MRENLPAERGRPGSDLWGERSCGQTLFEAAVPCQHQQPNADGTDVCRWGEERKELSRGMGDDGEPVEMGR